jgi:hypothetical protein
MVPLKTMMKVDDECHVELLNEVDSVKTIMMAEDERCVQVQKKQDPMKIMAVEDEHPAHSKNEKDLVEIETERLPFMLTEKTVGDSASM